MNRDNYYRIFISLIFALLVWAIYESMWIQYALIAIIETSLIFMWYTIVKK